MSVRGYRLDRFYRWVWEQEGQYTENITTEHVDAWMKALAHVDYTASYKTCYLEAVKTPFQWQNRKPNEEMDWDTVITYRDSSGPDQPRDFLTCEERQTLRGAVLEYESIPHHNGLTPEERDEWMAYLVQRFEKPNETVTSRFRGKYLSPGAGLSPWRTN